MSTVRALLVILTLLFPRGVLSIPRDMDSLNSFGSGDELDSRIAADSVSGSVVFAHDSGKGGLYLVTNGQPATTTPIANPLKWPKEPSISPGGRYVTYIDSDPESLLIGRTLYLTDTTTGKFRVIARGTTSHRVGQVAFSPDGKYLLYELIHMGKSFDIDEFKRVDLTTFQETSLLKSGEGSARAPAFSRDGRTLFYWNQQCLMRVDLSTHKRATQACLPEGARIWPTHQGEPPALSFDEKRIVVSALSQECPRLYIAEKDEKKFQPLSEDECGYTPHFVGEKGDTVSYVHLPLDGSRVLSLIELQTKAVKRLSPLEGIVYQPRVTKEGVYIVSATPSYTRRLQRFTLDGAPPVVIAQGSGVKGEEGLVKKFHRMRIPSGDGAQIPVAIFKPEGATTSGSLSPVVLYLHGSPLGADDVPPRLSREIGYLVGRGIEVIAVNYRGSTGYGETFKSSGKPDLQAKDVITALDYLSPSLAGRKVYAVGICFGGEHLLRRVIEARSSLFKGMVIWSGSLLPHTWMTPRSPKTLWVITKRDGILRREQSYLASQKKLGTAHPAQLNERVELDDTHLVLGGSNRLKALQAVARFIFTSSGVKAQEG